MIIEPNSRWKSGHTGTHYVVICVAEHVYTEERLVVYRPLDAIGRNWALPESEFLGTGTGDRRFERVPEPPGPHETEWSDMRQGSPDRPEPPNERPYMEDG